jgi:peptide-N4-(N-acetyl-beta-glucosaminyl)asparagine amidase
MAAEPEEIDDQQFRKRVQQGFATVQGWENEEIFHQCREELVPEAFYTEEATNEREAVLILAKHFQTKVMTWVNCPPCGHCGTAENVDRQDTTVKPLDENGATCRVEVVWCQKCETASEFPRYNSVRRLLQSRKGRCGEYANLFGCLCRAVGLETRYILDFTDHVSVYRSGEITW